MFTIFTAYGASLERLGMTVKPQDNIQSVGRNDKILIPAYYAQ